MLDLLELVTRAIGKLPKSVGFTFVIGHFPFNLCIPISSVRYLDLTFDPEEIDPADTVRALDFIATSDFGGREFMWNHILTSWRDPNIFPDGYGNQLVLSLIFFSNIMLASSFLPI